MALPEKDELNDKPIKSDREGFFKLVISDLEPDTVYPIQFRWAYQNGTFSPWSNIKIISTPDEGILNAPEFLDENLTSDEENIFVEWSGNDDNGDPYPENFKHIEIHYKPEDDTAYKIFGTKITKAKEKVTIPAKLDKRYYVKLRAISTKDLESPFSDIQDVLVESAPNNPPSNLNVSWSPTGSDLIFKFTHDTSLPANKTTKEYLVEMTHPVYGPHQDIIEKNTTSSQQQGAFTRTENVGRYGLPLATSLSGTLCAVNTKNKQSTKINWSAPTKVSTLPAPTITVSKGTGFYQVSWIRPVDDSLSTIVIEEGPSSSGPWTQVAISTSNPVVIQSNSATKYIRAIFYDVDDLPGQGYSSVYSVTPDPVVVEDETTPSAPGSVSVSANTLSSSELKNGVGSITVTWTITDLATYSKHGGVNIEYKLSTDSGYNSIFVPFTTSSPKYTHKIEGLIQGLAYNFRVSSVNGNTLKQSSFTISSPSSISVLSSTSISKPKTPEVFVGLDSTNTNPGPMAVRVRQYSQKSDSTDIEKDISHFEIWAIPSTYTSANDSVAQKIGTLKAAASGGNMNYVEGNFTVNVQVDTTYKFYSKAVNNGGYSSTASDLSVAKSIPFIAGAYISDLSADKITTGTLAATQYITVGTSSNSIKINSGNTDVSTYIQSGTGGYNNTSSGFYVDASGRFSLKDQLTFDGNNLTVKGAITAKSGTIENGNLQVTTGTIIAGTPGGNRVVMNSNGISAHYGGVEHTYIKTDNSTGGAPFYTTNAKIGNWIVNSTQIYNGKVTLDSSIPSVHVGNASNTFYVGMGQADSNGIIFWAGGSPTDRLNNVKFYIKGDGSVFIANGVQIGGYAKTSDIPDTSTFAKTDMSNVTTIDGGLIKTGTIKSQGYIGVEDGTAFSTTGTAIRLGVGGVLPAITSKNFRIDTSGTLYLKGDIQADTGRLGGTNGWSIESGRIVSTDGSENTYLKNPTSSDASTMVVLKIGDTFNVNKAGKLTATGADIKGRIEATSGEVGGWQINPSYISSGGTEIYNTGKIKIGASLGEDSLYMQNGSNIRMDSGTNAAAINFHAPGVAQWDAQIIKNSGGDFAVRGYYGGAQNVLIVRTFIAEGVVAQSYNNGANQDTLTVRRNFGTDSNRTSDINQTTRMIQFQKSHAAGSTYTNVGHINAGSTVSVPTFQAASDERLKKNIEVFDGTEFVQDIKNISTYKYHGLESEDDNPKVIGWMAKEFYPKYPDVVDGIPEEVDQDGNPIYMQMSREALIPHLFNAVKYLVIKVEELEQRFN